MSIIVKGNPFPQSEEAIHAQLQRYNDDSFYISEVYGTDSVVFSAKNKNCARELMARLHQITRAVEHEINKEQSYSSYDHIAFESQGLYALEFVVRARSASVHVKEFTDASDVLVIIPNSPQGAKDLIDQFERAISEIKTVFKFDNPEQL